METLLFIIAILLLSLQIKALTKQEIYYFEDLDKIVQARLKFYAQQQKYIQKRIKKTKFFQIKVRLCRKLSKIENEILKTKKYLIQEEENEN